MLLKTQQFFFELFNLLLEFVQKRSLRTVSAASAHRSPSNCCSISALRCLMEEASRAPKSASRRSASSLRSMASRLFAQFQLFHQERGVAHRMLFVAQIEAVQR